MGQIIPANQFNPAALNADDLYIVIVNPPSYIRGLPSDVVGFVGTGSWGPVNAAVHGSSAQDFANSFGPISSASLTDQYDMATDIALAFGQGNGPGQAIEGWGVRISDGTDTPADHNLTGVTSAASETATIGGTVTPGDTISITATSSAITGSPVTISYTTLAGDTTIKIANAFAAAFNANAALAAVGLFANAASSVVTLQSPGALSPAITWTRSVAGSTNTITLANGGALPTGAHATAIYTGVLGNQVQVSFQAGSQTGGITVSVSPPSGVSEVYPNLPSANFWVTLAAAWANGISGVRGPSEIVTARFINPAVSPPVLPSSVTLGGGTDGRAGVTLGNIIGDDTAVPKTGMYALRSQTPAVGVTWLTGVTNATAWPSLLAFGQTEGSAVLAALPPNTSTATAVAAVATNGIHDPALTYTKDWVYFFDSINNVIRSASPNAFIGGAWAALSPAQSPSNKPVNLVLGTDRNPPNQAGIPYQDSEIGQLAAAGITLITNPIPAGSQWGIREGQSTSLDAVTQPMEYFRLTAWLARSFNAQLGKFVGQLQSQRPNDPLRQAVKLALNDFLTNLVGAVVLDDFVVVCAFSSSPTAVPGLGINTPASVSQHFLYAFAQVRYLSSVRFFILSLQGGTTVVTVTGAQPSQ